MNNVECARRAQTHFVVVVAYFSGLTERVAFRGDQDVIADIGGPALTPPPAPLGMQIPTTLNPCPCLALAKSFATLSWRRIYRAPPAHSRRNHTPGFKAKVALAAIKGGRTLAQLAEQFDVHPNHDHTWKAQLEEGAADVFGSGGGNGGAQPAIDVKSLHAKIGELTLENDSLETATSALGSKGWRTNPSALARRCKLLTTRVR
jgi:transposase-like protein